MILQVPTDVLLSLRQAMPASRSTCRSPIPDRIRISGEETDPAQSTILSASTRFVTAPGHADRGNGAPTVKYQVLDLMADQNRQVRDAPERQA